MAAQTTLKILLGFEEISAYLQYNARCEFFTNSSFGANPECKDNECRERQKEFISGKRSWLKDRKEKVASQKAKKSVVFGGDQIKAEDWGIELVGESEERKEVFIDKKDLKDATLEDLMAKMKGL